MANMTDKEIKKLLKEASKTLRKGMAIDANKQKDSGNPIKIDMKIEIGIGGSPAMAGPSGEYITLETCYYFCYTIGGQRFCKSFCW
ncbi:MAG: hypothetical protein DRQ62_05625 [Gammaproteobacteria bacterium]|nr:MAG: hypothetical protein DRQ62_05625 [Gammaproteobacteria bacterium]